ncbi:MAG: YkgJ family cysteine cluster protein [Vulcanimicrobiaceae bacterium]
MIEPANLRSERWLRCPVKTCCSYYSVFVTGDDVARIARTLAVPPWTFTAALPCRDEELGAFALDRSDKRFRIALVRIRVSAENEPFCTFLVRVPDGTARCGLGAGRPATCRTFPAQLIDGGIQFETSGCTCDWSGAVGDSQDTALLRAEEQARRRYAAVVTAWNDYVARLAEPAGITYPDFCRYLLDTYSP